MSLRPVVSRRCPFVRFSGTQGIRTRDPPVRRPLPLSPSLSRSTSSRTPRIIALHSGSTPGAGTAIWPPQVFAENSRCARVVNVMLGSSQCLQAGPSESLPATGAHLSRCAGGRKGKTQHLTEFLRPEASLKSTKSGTSWADELDATENGESAARAACMDPRMLARFPTLA